MEKGGAGFIVVDPLLCFSLDHTLLIVSTVSVTALTLHIDLELRSFANSLGAGPLSTVEA